MAILKIRELFHPKEFQAALWPYRYSSLFFTHCNFSSKKLRVLYVVTVLLFYLLLPYSTVNEILSKIFLNIMPIDIFHLNFIARTFFIQIHLFVWLFVGYKCYTDVVSSLMLIDRELNKLCSLKVNLKSTVIREIICKLFLTLLIFALISGFARNDKNKFNLLQAYHIGILWYPQVVNVYVVTFFSNLVYFIGERYALVNQALKMIDESEETINKTGCFLIVTLDKVILTRQLRIVHRQLFFISRTLMKAFAIQIFAYIGSSYFYTIEDLYLLYVVQYSPCCKSIKNKTNINISIIIAMIYDFFIIIYVTYCCHQTMREANGTTKILSSLIIDNEILNFEVSSFSHQLMHYQLELSLLGFFKLDLEFLQDMIATIATYMVATVQLGLTISDTECDITTRLSILTHYPYL